MNHETNLSNSLPCLSPKRDYLSSVTLLTGMFPNIWKWQRGTGSSLTCPIVFFSVFRYIADLNTQKSPSFNDSKSQPSL